jgi:hypothetical protein
MVTVGGSPSRSTSRHRSASTSLGLAPVAANNSMNAGSSRPGCPPWPTTFHVGFHRRPNLAELVRLGCPRRCPRGLHRLRLDTKLNCASARPRYCAQ